MTQELNLIFTDPDRVSIAYNEQKTKNVPFVSPLNEKDYQDIRRHFEMYAGHYTMDPDDKSAQKIAEQLPIWGAALFNAVFGNSDAKQMFDRFLNTNSLSRHKKI